jgi:hypothetical protein
LGGSRNRPTSSSSLFRADLTTGGGRISMASAFRGQRWVQRAQPRHRCSSITAFLSRTEIAFIRQNFFRTQEPQPVHLSALTRMCTPGIRAYLSASSLERLAADLPMEVMGSLIMVISFQWPAYKRDGLAHSESEDVLMSLHIWSSSPKGPIGVTPKDRTGGSMRMRSFIAICKSSFH